MGAKFYRDESEYLPSDEQSIKDPISATLPTTSCSNVLTRSPTKSRKRPRRSAAAAVHSYVVPDSDEDTAPCDKVKGKAVTLTIGQTKDDHLRLWMSHLKDLLNSEQRKVKLLLNLHQLV